MENGETTALREQSPQNHDHIESQDLSYPIANAKWKTRQHGSNKGYSYNDC